MSRLFTLMVDPLIEKMEVHQRCSFEESWGGAGKENNAMDDLRASLRVIEIRKWHRKYLPKRCL